MTTLNPVPANPAIALRLQSTRPVGRVVRRDRIIGIEVPEPLRLTDAARRRRSGETPSRQIAVRPTTKRLARIAGLGAAALAAVGVLWVLLDEPDSNGPLIKGKPVAFWTWQLRFGQMDPDVISTLAAEKGVAIPALVRQLSLPDSVAKDSAKRLWRRLPASLRERIPEPTTRAEVRAGAAFALVAICDPNGPSLSEAQMILPALTKALRDRDAGVRYLATGALGSLSVTSAQAIESCETPLKDPQWTVRYSAVSSLGRLAKADERAIPRLRSALSDSRLEVRQRAAEQLESLGIPPPRDDAPSATETK